MVMKRVAHGEPLQKARSPKRPGFFIMAYTSSRVKPRGDEPLYVLKADVYTEVFPTHVGVNITESRVNDVPV